MNDEPPTWWLGFAEQNVGMTSLCGVGFGIMRWLGDVVVSAPPHAHTLTLRSRVPIVRKVPRV